MKIVVFGATGEVGSRVVREALTRGHDVTAAVRNPDAAESVAPGARLIQTDAGNSESVLRAVTGQDLVVSALRPAEGHEALLVDLTRSVLDAAASVSVPAVIVGGAARLRLPDDPAHTVLTAPDFLPPSVVPIATACQRQYDMVVARKPEGWSYISPSAMLAPGRRTGSYRTGTDTLIVDQDGRSAISMEDFAVAILDEAESANRRGTAFTVGY